MDECRDFPPNDDVFLNLCSDSMYGSFEFAESSSVILVPVSIPTIPSSPGDDAGVSVSFSSTRVDHASLGFRFRTEPVAAELTALSAVADGLNRALLTGYVDPEVELPNYIDALKAAGIDAVKAEVERQYEDWKFTQNR